MPVFEINVAQICQLWKHSAQPIGPNILHVSDLWTKQIVATTVQLSYKNNCSVTIPAQLVPIEGFTASHIHLSPEFIVNSLPELSVLPVKVVLSFDTARHNDLESSVDYPTADVAKIALVRSSSYPTEYDYTDSVTLYFSEHPILVKVEDAVSIPLSGFDEAMLLQLYPGMNCDFQTVAMKVISAEVRSKQEITLFYIDSKKTSMFQKGSCNERIWKLRDLSATQFTSSAEDLVSGAIWTLRNSLLSTRSSLPFFVLKGEAGSGKRYLVDTLAKRLGYNLCSISAYELYSNTAATIEEKFRNAIQLHVDYNPCIICLENMDCLLTKNIYGNLDERVVASLAQQIEEVIYSFAPKKNLIFIATVKESPPYSIQRLVSKEFNVSRLEDKERRCIIENTILSESNIYQVDYSAEDIDYLVRQTVVYLAGDLVNLVHKIITITAEEDSSPHASKQQTFDSALKALFKERDDNFNIQTIQKVHWNDVGGLSKIIDEVCQTIQLATSGRSLLPEGTKLSNTGGILFYGPPGTGKTLLAKAVATECSLNFISVKGPELVNMYVGKSEENVRELFARLRVAAPCILFCDELDSLAPRRGWSADSGGVMDRLVAQLATEMDSLSQEKTGSHGIVLIGATNRPDLIDPALLRPGRFDRMFYVGGNSDKTAQRDVLHSLTRTFPLEDEQDGLLEDVVDRLPERITGADIYAVCTVALQKSFRRLIQGQDSSQLTDDAMKLSVSVIDFQEAASEITVSVTDEDFLRYDKMKEYFSV